MQKNLKNCLKSLNASKLEVAGYVKIEKEFVGKKPHMMLLLTDKGRAAFREYRQSMKRLFNDLPEE